MTFEHRLSHNANTLISLSFIYLPFLSLLTSVQRITMVHFLLNIPLYSFKFSEVFSSGTTHQDPCVNISLLLCSHIFALSPSCSEPLALGKNGEDRILLLTDGYHYPSGVSQTSLPS